MKKALLILLAALLLLSAAACSGGQGSNSEPVGGGIQTAAIVFDFSNGSPEEDIRMVTHYSYSDIAVEEKIEMLRAISGLDFLVTIPEDADRFVVDWAADSTLIAGLDDREQNEDYHFYDADSLRWFMMDSLWQTLGKGEIYYTMDGGKELAFDELYPVDVFPADLPYMGSAFYFAHAEAAEGYADDDDSSIAGEMDFDTALPLIEAAMAQRGETATVFVQTGEETIGGEHALTFSAGENSADGLKYTALVHYAVTDSGLVYYIDIPKGPDWVLFDGTAAG